MSSVKKKHFYILGVSLFVSFFILFDAYVGPTKSRQEIITDRYSLVAYAPSVGRGGTIGSGDYYKKYYLITDRSRYLITYDLFQKLDSDNNIIVSRSLITNTRRKITYLFRKNQYSYNSNVLALSGSAFFIIITIICILLSMLFYDYFPYPPGRSALIVALCVVSFILLMIYIIANIYYYEIFF